MNARRDGIPAPALPDAARTPAGDASAGEGLRYQRIAAALRGAIASGAYPVGGALPTEAELTARHGVSRHTVREALRRLADLGLVERRQGAATRVVATKPRTGFVQTVRSLDELLQYARGTDLAIAEAGLKSIDADEAEFVPAPEGSRWLRIAGVRWTGGHDEALCWTTVFVNARFAALLGDVRTAPGPIYALIESRSGEVIAEAVQEIAARPLPPRGAKALGMRAGVPTLRFVRRYLDASGGPMLTSVNWHPAERFSYVMRLKRGDEH